MDVDFEVFTIAKVVWWPMVSVTFRCIWDQSDVNISISYLVQMLSVLLHPFGW